MENGLEKLMAEVIEAKPENFKGSSIMYKAGVEAGFKAVLDKLKPTLELYRLICLAEDIDTHLNDEVELIYSGSSLSLDQPPPKE